MTTENLKEAVLFHLKKGQNLMIKGPPGIGKTSIINQCVESLGWKLITKSAVTENILDVKGAPFNTGNGYADYLHFLDDRAIWEAEEPTVVFYDDFIQAPDIVQAAIMSLLIGNKKVSPHVRFISATNERGDMAGGSSVLEPVKDRFCILKMEVDAKAWIKWAIGEGLPHELWSFIQDKPTMLHQFEATKEMTNSPTPRGAARCGQKIQEGLPDKLYGEVFTGDNGAAFAQQLLAHIRLKDHFPDLSQIEKEPMKAKIPSAEEGSPMSIMYALFGALSSRVENKNADNIMKYVRRFPKEYQTVAVRTFYQTQKVFEPMIDWVSENPEALGS